MSPGRACDGYTLRRAALVDAKAVTALVDRAYGHYVERLGGRPGPMAEDYARVIRDHEVILAESGEAIVGVLVLAVTDAGFTIENVAVDPADRGRGLGRILLELAEAEARRAGFDSIHLYTHERMVENLALYRRIGYLEYGRRPIGGASLVLMRKRLT